MRKHARVVVIGGGAVGCSILYHLTQAGVNDCLLIEKDELTSGSTWHAAGNIPTYATSWLGMRAGNYAWQLYKDLAEKLDSPITYRHTGAFWPAHTPDRMDLYNHLVGLSKSAGFELALLSPSEMEAMHPFYTAGDSVIGGILDPYEGDIDPSQLTQALAKGARDAGAEVNRFTSVTGLELKASGEWIVKTNRGSITGEIVVNAAGFYGSQISGFAGQQLPIATLEHQYLVTEAIPDLQANSNVFPLVRDPDIRFYLRRERTGFLFGSYGHAGRPAFNDGLPSDFAHQLFPDSIEDIAAILERAVAHIPLLGETGAQRFVNGPIAYSPDALPLCGPAFALPNFYHACGIQIGITHSAAAGKAISEWIVEGETEWDLAAWDPRRFGDWATPHYAVQRAVEMYDLQYSIPYPHRLYTSARPVQRTPLYETLKDKGAVFGQIGGWERAFWFDSHADCEHGHLSFRNQEQWRAAVKHECEAVRDHVGIMDHGGFTKYEVVGKGAEAFLNRVFCGGMPAIGRIKLSYMLTPKGRIWSEATIAHLSEDRYLLCGPTLAVNRDFDWLRSHQLDTDDVSLTLGSQCDAALLLMGPDSRTLLSAITNADLSKDRMPWMSVAEIDVAGCPVSAMRVSYVGELGWELHLPSIYLSTVYTAIAIAGKDTGLVNFGSYALNSMRMEKSYHGWGADFGIEYSLFDAGLEKFADLTKSHFIGKQAVIEQQSKPAEWRFVRMVIDSGVADPLAGDPISNQNQNQNQIVGYVTSAGTGFRIGKCIALGYIKSNVDWESQEFHVEVLGKKRLVTFSECPFYDPENSRLNS